MRALSPREVFRSGQSLGQQLGPSRELGLGAAARRLCRGGERNLLAARLLAADNGVEEQRIGGRGGQPAQRGARRTGSGRDGHLRIGRCRGGLVAEAHLRNRLVTLVAQRGAHRSRGGGNVLGNGLAQHGLRLLLLVERRETALLAPVLRAVNRHEGAERIGRSGLQAADLAPQGRVALRSGDFRPLARSPLTVEESRLGGAILAPIGVFARKQRPLLRTLRGLGRREVGRRLGLYALGCGGEGHRRRVETGAGDHHIAVIHVFAFGLQTGELQLHALLVPAVGLYAHVIVLAAAELVGETGVGHLALAGVFGMEPHPAIARLVRLHDAERRTRHVVCRIVAIVIARQRRTDEHHHEQSKKSLHLNRLTVNTLICHMLFSSQSEPCGPPPHSCGYSRRRESIQMVTGPSLTSATCMSAPNSPVATGRPVSASTAATKRS